MIEVICAVGNIGREVRVFLCLDMMVAHDVSEPVRPSLGLWVCCWVQLEGCAWLRLAFVAELESTDQIWTCFITFPQCSTSVGSQSFTRTNKYFRCYSHILSLYKLYLKPSGSTTHGLPERKCVSLFLSVFIVVWYESIKKLNKANIFR